MSVMAVIKRGKYNYNPKPRKICNMPVKPFFGTDSIKAQHERVCKILGGKYGISAI